MKVHTIFLIISLLHAVNSYAQWPSNVMVLDPGEKSSIEVQGDLATGKVMEDLSWAWNSSTACFPETQASKFRGNHVFYAITMPTHCEMTISVVPTDNKGDLSIYAYRIGASAYDLVPDLSRCITCEADYKWDKNWKGKVQTSERRVSMQNPSSNNYNILIGVAGPASVTKGIFTLSVQFTR